MERSFEILEKACYSCFKCGLSETRTNVVIGKGNRNADIMFIGEGPGEREDIEGEVFVGPAGKLLDKMLASIGLSTENVYIANIVKCRPPKNRNPYKEEIDSCVNYLKYQILLVKPKIIVCLGKVAASVVIEENFPITKLHGVWYEKNGYSIMATYHPSALLRDETKKRPAWEDLKSLREKIHNMDINI